MFSHGSCSSISLAIDTPSLVMVGAPHFFSRTTLRPRGPNVTLTASARVFMPRSNPRRACSSNAIILTMAEVLSNRSSKTVIGADARDGRTLTVAEVRTETDHRNRHSHAGSANAHSTQIEALQAQPQVVVAFVPVALGCVATT